MVISVTIVNASIGSIMADTNSPTGSLSQAEPDSAVAATCKGLSDCNWLGKKCEGIFITWWNDEEGDVEGDCDNSTADVGIKGITDLSALSPEELKELKSAEQAFVNGEVEEVEAERVAFFEFPDNRQVHFFAVPEDREVEVVEIAPSGQQSKYVNRDSSILDIFLKIAPEGSPVPETILDVASDDGRDVSNFTVTDVIEDTVIPKQPLDLTGTSQVAAVGYCTNSPAGVLYFTQHSCKNENLQTSFCDAGSFINGGGWLELNRMNSSKKKKSYSRTAACVGSGQAKHYYWGWSVSQNKWTWKTKKTIEIGANSQIWKTAKGAKRWRRIRHLTYHPLTGGFIRAWSEFYN